MASSFEVLLSLPCCTCSNTNGLGAFEASNSRARPADLGRGRLFKVDEIRDLRVSTFDDRRGDIDGKDDVHFSSAPEKNCGSEVSAVVHEKLADTKLRGGDGLGRDMAEGAVCVATVRVCFFAP